MSNQHLTTIGWGLPGQSELVIIVVLILILLFGAKKLPELARSLGRSLTEFKRGREEDAGEKLSGDTDSGDTKPPDS